MEAQQVQKNINKGIYQETLFLVSITNDATVEYDVCANLDEGVEFAVIENEFMVSPGTHDYIIVIDILPETLSGTYNLNLTVSRGGCY